MTMTSINANRKTSSSNWAESTILNRCRQIRTWPLRIVSSNFRLNAKWVEDHIANCPRCQQRLAAMGKVELALSLVKSHSHGLDLLKRANAQAIGVLKHSLRQALKAEELKNKLPEPNLSERYGKYKHSAANMAACLAILFLMKIGVFTSMDSFQARSQEVFKQYYAKHIGQDLADDIFAF